jgi:hypothetical protein
MYGGDPMRKLPLVVLLPLIVLIAVCVSAATVLVVNAVYDIPETAAPANPASGFERFYADSTSHNFTCLTHAGASCLPTGGGGGGNVITVVQGKMIRGTSQATAINVASGHVVAACLGWYGGATTGSSLADSLTTSYTKVTEQNPGTGHNVALFVGTLGSSGADTLTGTFPAGAGFEGVGYFEFSNVTATVDASGNVGQGSPLSITTATDGDVIISCNDDDSSSAAFSGVPGFFTPALSSGSDSGAIVFGIQPKAGVLLCSIQFIGATGYDANACMALKHP